MTRLYVDGPTLIRAVRAATRNLERHVDEIDSLNVFPVPDGDTGSNMLATMKAALAEAEALPESERDLDSVADALSKGALTGARGNSGVILSQIIRGMTHGADGKRRASGIEFAEGLRKGSEVAYQSVLTPVEGTILTVIRDAADAAATAAGRQPHVEAVLAETIEAAASSVQRTPTLLPVLEDAGVVDSGGQGLYRVLEGMLQVEGGGRRARSSRPPQTAAAAVEPISLSALNGQGQPGGSAAEHGYETQFIVSSAAAAIDVPALREAIQAVGDSVVVAGDERLVRVHVHGERPDLAIAAGLPWGRLSQVEVLDLDDQVAHNQAHSPDHDHLEPATEATQAPAEAPAIALVAVTRAPGLADVLASFGARIVVPGHGSRPSVGEIAEAILASGAGGVIVLPNDRDAILAAGQAASLAPLVSVEVIPTRNAAEGIAAAFAFDPDASLAANVERMRADAESLRSFTVITAAKDSVVDGRPVKEGQILALDAGRHLLAAGDDVESVTLKALSRFEDVELITLYCGDSEGGGASSALCERIELAGFGAEVEVINGGQPHDHLLVAVE
ncbi:MAG: DAK2 domain-containing protein [Candidatus Limnocylindrales bacterium]